MLMMAGKYEPLIGHLSRCETDRERLTSSEIETILGDELPRSARLYRPWWGNERSLERTQAQAWLSAGWRVETVDQRSGWVTFVLAG
jgi:hypothetical protein